MKWTIKTKKLMLNSAEVERAIGRRGQIALTRYGSIARQESRKGIKIVAPTDRQRSTALDNISSGEPARVRRGEQQLQRIRTRQSQVSRPGGYPVSHTRDKVVSIRNIRYYYDRTRQSVVYGPIKLSSRRGQVPNVLQEGGPAKIKEVEFRGAWIPVSRRYRGRGRTRTRTVRIRPRPTVTLTYATLQQRRILEKSFEYADKKLGGR